MENTNYEGLSKIYDMMMLGVDYEAWADYILDAAKTAGSPCKKVLDLACGTGSTTIPLAKRGIAVEGLDLSEAMIALAEEKTRAAGLTIPYHRKNMLAMHFETAFDTIVSFQDGINYLTGDGDFYRLAENVGKALKPHGVFLFDLNLVDEYSDSETTVIDLDDLYMVYENHYIAAKKIWRIKVTGFLPEGDLYRRFEEIHEEKNHDLNEVKEALCQNGMELFALWRIFTKDAPSQGTRRILVVAKKK